MLFFYRAETNMKTQNMLVYYTYSIFELLFNIKNWPILIPIFLRRPARGNRILKLRTPPVKMGVRGAMDAWSVKETFIDAFYTRVGVPIEDDWTVIDIGAGIGDFSIYAAFGRPNTWVYAFEPFPDSYDYLKKNLALNDVTNVEAFQEAVWSSAGELVLDVSGEEPLQVSSREEEERAIEDTGHAVEVPAVALAAVLARHGLERVDLLKLDCEGAEYEILMSTSGAVLERIHRIVMEYHYIDQDHRRETLVEFLEAAGYRVSWQENFVHDDIGYLYAERQADALRRAGKADSRMVVSSGS
jgi:FkbM family methyltransferase